MYPRGGKRFGNLMRLLLPGLEEHLQLLSSLEKSLVADRQSIYSIFLIMELVPDRFESRQRVCAGGIRVLRNRDRRQRTRVTLENRGNIASRLRAREIGMRL